MAVRQQVLFYGKEGDFERNLAVIEQSFSSLCELAPFKDNPSAVPTCQLKDPYFVAYKFLTTFARPLQQLQNSCTGELDAFSAARVNHLDENVWQFAQDYLRKIRKLDRPFWKFQSIANAYTQYYLTAAIESGSETAFTRAVWLGQITLKTCCGVVACLNRDGTNVLLTAATCALHGWLAAEAVSYLSSSLKPLLSLQRTGISVVLLMSNVYHKLEDLAFARTVAFEFKQAMSCRLWQIEIMEACPTAVGPYEHSRTFRLLHSAALLASYGGSMLAESLLDRVLAKAHTCQEAREYTEFQQRTYRLMPHLPFLAVFARQAVSLNHFTSSRKNWNSRRSKSLALSVRYILTYESGLSPCSSLCDESRLSSLMWQKIPHLRSPEMTTKLFAVFYNLTLAKACRFLSRTPSTYKAGLERDLDVDDSPAAWEETYLTKAKFLAPKQLVSVCTLCAEELALYYERQGELYEASAHAQRTLLQRTTYLPSGHPLIKKMLRILYRIFGRSGDSYLEQTYASRLSEVEADLDGWLWDTNSQGD